MSDIDIITATQAREIKIGTRAGRDGIAGYRDFTFNGRLSLPNQPEHFTAELYQNSDGSGPWLAVIRYRGLEFEATHVKAVDAARAAWKLLIERLTPETCGFQVGDTVRNRFLRANSPIGTVIGFETDADGQVTVGVSEPLASSGVIEAFEKVEVSAEIVADPRPAMGAYTHAEALVMHAEFLANAQGVDLGTRVQTNEGRTGEVYGLWPVSEGDQVAKGIGPVGLAITWDGGRGGDADLATVTPVSAEIKRVRAAELADGMRIDLPLTGAPKRVQGSPYPTNVVGTQGLRIKFTDGFVLDAHPDASFFLSAEIPVTTEHEISLSAFLSTKGETKSAPVDHKSTMIAGTVQGMAPYRMPVGSERPLSPMCEECQNGTIASHEAHSPEYAYGFKMMCPACTVRHIKYGCVIHTRALATDIYALWDSSTHVNGSPLTETAYGIRRAMVAREDAHTEALVINAGLIATTAGKGVGARVRARSGRFGDVLDVRPCMVVDYAGGPDFLHGIALGIAWAGGHVNRIKGDFGTIEDALMDDLEPYGMSFEGTHWHALQINEERSSGLEVGTPVRAEFVDDSDERQAVYGFVAAGPLAETDTRKGFDRLVMSERGIVAPYAREELTERSGCECGNPFSLCHPDA